MKQIKVTFLFFCICMLFLNQSCHKNRIERKEIKPLLDSVDVFINKMKNKEFDFKTRLNYSTIALQKANSSRLDETTIEILNYRINLFRNLKQYDSAIYISKKLVKKSIEKNDSSSIGKLYSKLANYYTRDKQNDSAYYYYNLIKNGYLKYIDSITNGRNLVGMAIIESSIGDYNSSEYSSSLALKYSNGKDPYTASAVYNNWAISSRKQGQLENALLFYKKAVKFSTLKEHKIIIKNNIAVNYRDLGDYNKSIKILDSLKKDTTTNLVTRARIIDNLAYIKWLAKSKENVLPELEKALKIRLLKNNSYGLIASYSHLSKYFEKLNAEIAISYATQMYDVAISQKSTQDQLEALQLLIKLDTTSKIKKYYTSYVKIKDSLDKAQSKAKNIFAKIKYDSEKNQKENLQLKIIQTTTKLELEKEKTRNIIGATSSATAILGLIGFGYYRRKKQQQEKREEVYKTETRIAKKIHDEVANNVVNVMNKIQYTKEPKEKILEDLEEVYLLTRNISHQNNTIETGNNFEYSLKALLTSFNTNTTTIILKGFQNVKLTLLPKEKQIEVYRILQELMVNMQKHSKATLVAISFKKNKDQYSINYLDNGVGVALKEFSLKNGLTNVETRIESINGIITFETSLRKGFKAFISFKR